MNTAPIPGNTVRDLRIKKRIQIVHVAKAQLKLDDDNYRAILSQWNVKSSKDMTLLQLEQLLAYFKTLGFRGRPGHSAIRNSQSAMDVPSSVPPCLRGEKKQYASSLDGLRNEIKDLAIARWTESGWEQPLNNFCRRFGIQRWQWLDVAHGKEVKAALLRLSSPTAP